MDIERYCSITDSSNVKGIGYNIADKTLIIKFKSGTYSYSPVDLDQFGALVSAESVGSAVDNWKKRAAPQFRKV